MRAIRVVAASLVVVLLSSDARATTYVVPDDREMIAASRAIVVGTVTGSFCRRVENGLIETVTEVTVEERLKGPDVRTISVAVWGGRIGDESLSLVGAPTFQLGERVLLFLDRDGRGGWTTYGLALGVFRFRRDATEEPVLERSEDILERVRFEREFLDFVRGAVRGEERPYVVNERRRAMTPQAIPTSGGYALRSNVDLGKRMRRTGSALGASWRVFGSQTDLDLPAAVDFGSLAWNGQSASIHYSRSVSPASGNTVGRDAESRVIANDPHGLLPGSCCPGIAAAAFQFESGTHSFGGETFSTIVESDIVVNDGVSEAELSGTLENVITHELGHTLGFRHSDKDAADDGTCLSPLDCCNHDNDGGHCEAIMNSFVIGSVNDLQGWDLSAVDCLYDGICAERPCIAPSLIEEPQDKTVEFGAGTSLIVKVGGTPPLEPQWYAGKGGDTSTPTGTGAWDLRIVPTSPGSFWLRVTGACGEPAESRTAVVKVVPCSDVVITNAYALSGTNGQVTLSADATGSNLRYRWFRGDTPGADGTVVGTGKQATVTVTGRTSFWARAENVCGKSAVSERVFAAPCGLPAIVVQPVDQTIDSGRNATLSIVLASDGTVTWYRGVPPDVSAPVGAGNSVQVGPLAATTTFWGNVDNACGAISTRVVTVDVLNGRRRVVRH